MNKITKTNSERLVAENYQRQLTLLAYIQGKIVELA